ncbi:MAG: hypothetical protein RLY76_420 [Actinomycetota bacterium]
MMSRYNVGGTAQWLYQLGMGLQENQIQNILLIGECQSGELEDSRIGELNFVRIEGLGPKTSILKTFLALLHIRKEIKRFRPEIVNTHTSKAGALGRIAALTVKPRPRIIHTYHGHVLSGYFGASQAFAVKTIEKILSLFTDYFFVSGQQVLQDIRNANIIRKNNFYKVWPSVPDFDIQDRALTRLKYGIAPEKLVVGWLGRKVQIKRIDRILELAHRNSNVTFIIAGDGNLSDLDYLKSIPVDDNVIELGFTKPSEMWSICDICIITSDNEAIPISPIEAALAKVPLIALDAGSTREVLINGKTGILCAKESDDLFLALQKLIGNKKLRLEMGEAARNFVLSKFAPSEAVQHQIAGYRAVLERSI